MAMTLALLQLCIDFGFKTTFTLNTLFKVELQVKKYILYYVIHLKLQKVN